MAHTATLVPKIQLIRAVDIKLRFEWICLRNLALSEKWFTISALGIAKRTAFCVRGFPILMD